MLCQRVEVNGRRHWGLRPFDPDKRKAAFRAMDRDGDMALSLREFSGSEMGHAPLAKARRLFDVMVAGRDQAIRFDEYRRRPWPELRKVEIAFCLAS